MPDAPPTDVRRLLVVMPSWVGDVVMATPTLRALRGLYPEAHIACLVKSTVKPVLESTPWADRLLSIRSRRRPGSGVSPRRGRRGPFALAARLRRGAFDTAVLLPNSFRTALLARMANIPRRVGYDRDGRGFLLTDRLLPLREVGRLIPVPTVEYYLGLARYLGASNADATMALHTRPEQDAEADRLLAAAGVDPGRPLVCLNPGANYGDAKIWAADRFAAVADALAERHHAAVVMNGSPRERDILDDVHRAAKRPIVDLPRVGGNLGLLKSILRRCALMVTNDTGPRHMAVAMGVPVVTVFGPTDPRWSATRFPREREVRVDVFCGPCQKKVCPLDHRCMTQVTPEMVLARAEELLAPRGPGVSAAKP